MHAPRNGSHAEFMADEARARRAAQPPPPAVEDQTRPVQMRFEQQTAMAACQLSTMLLGPALEATIAAVSMRMPGSAFIDTKRKTEHLTDTIPAIAANLALYTAQQLIALQGQFVQDVEGMLALEAAKRTEADAHVHHALKRKSQGFDDSSPAHHANDARLAGERPAPPDQGSSGGTEPSAGSGAEDAVATPGRIVQP